MNIPFCNFNSSKISRYARQMINIIKGASWWFMSVIFKNSVGLGRIIFTTFQIFLIRCCRYDYDTVKLRNHGCDEVWIRREHIKVLCFTFLSNEIYKKLIKHKNLGTNWNVIIGTAVSSDKQCLFISCCYLDVHSIDTRYRKQHGSFWINNNIFASDHIWYKLRINSLLRKEGCSV